VPHDEDRIKFTFYAMKILLVDDDIEVQEEFIEALKMLDMDVHLAYARNAEELFAHLEKEHDINLLLLDINMPKRNGKECLKDLKSHTTFSTIPVVMFTVSKSEADIEETYAGGAHYYMIKPYSPLNFPSTLKALLGEVNWKEKQSVPGRDKFVINVAYQ
jgi:DNA-binding response OmpR family regulator